KHGKTALITHNGSGMFSYLSQPLEVMLYHSHVIGLNKFPHQFEITAKSLDTDEVMAIKHRTYSLYGLQFHSEYIETKTGEIKIRNWLDEVGRGRSHEVID